MRLCVFLRGCTMGMNDKDQIRKMQTKYLTYLFLKQRFNVAQLRYG